MMRRRWLAGLLAAVLAVALAGCGEKDRADGDPNQVWEEQLFAMDTVMTLTAYGPGGQDAVAQAVEEIRRLDALWSAENPDSQIARLNRGEDVALSEDTQALLGRALEICRETEGLFDPTIYPLVTLWGFNTDHPKVPDQGDIEAALAAVDGMSLTLDNGVIDLGEGRAIDLGGIAKGYASARVMEIFRAHGVTSGIVSLGGNIQTLGVKPDGSLWRVGIQDPEDPAGVVGALSVADRAVITSGGYERYFEEDGQRYIHILDPRTGRPALSDLTSVTVISADGALADGLSTALYIMGSLEAAEFWAQRADRFDMILLTVDGQMWATQGVADQLRTQLPVRVQRVENS